MQPSQQTLEKNVYKCGHNSDSTMMPNNQHDESQDITGRKRLSDANQQSKINTTKSPIAKPAGDGPPPSKRTRIETTRPAATFQHFKKLVNGDNKASDYAKTTGGIIIARDLEYFDRKQSKIVQSKQYYVLPDWNHVYNFIFGHHKIEERDFYEIIPENKPVRLTLDLEIEPHELCEGEELIATTDALEKDVIHVVVNILQEKYQVEVDENEILSLNSDGVKKGSRHVIFPVWFDCFASSMKTFINFDVLSAISDSTQRCLDASIYNKWRQFRFFGNTKIGSPRRLHLKEHPDLQPFTAGHRKIFDAALVQATPPDGYEPIHIDTPVADERCKSRKRHCPRLTSTGRSSETCELMLKARKHLGVKGTFDYVSLTTDEQGVQYQATSSEWTCCWGHVHTSNRTLRVYPDYVHCFGNKKDVYKCGTCYYPPLVDELIIRNEEDIRKLVCEHWDVKNVSVSVKGHTIFYTAGLGKKSYYNQKIGRLQHGKDNAKEKVEMLPEQIHYDVPTTEEAMKIVTLTIRDAQQENKGKNVFYSGDSSSRFIYNTKNNTLIHCIDNVKQQVADFHGVLAKDIQAKTKGNKIIYTTPDEQVSTYNRMSQRLVLKSSGVDVTPVYHLWEADDWGKPNKTKPPHEPCTVRFEGDTIVCAGSRLPIMELYDGDEPIFDESKGILYIPKDCTVDVTANMERGKTYTSMRLVKKAVESGESFLYPTYRQSLAIDIFNNLKKAGINNVLHYQLGLWRDGVLIPFHESQISEASVMVVQLESMPKAMSRHWGNIIFDEIQGTSAQFASGKITFGKCKNCKSWDAWKMLRFLCSKASFVMGLDADMHSWSIRGLEFLYTAMRPNGKKYHIEHRGKPKKRIYVEVKAGLPRLLGLFESAIIAGKKPAFISNAAKAIEKAQGIALKHTSKVLCFYGKHGLDAGQDINQLAASCDVLGISSGKIGSGVSIENKLMEQYPDFNGSFDVVFFYGFAHDMTSPVREANQCLSRPRDNLSRLYLYNIASIPDMERIRNFPKAIDEVKSLAAQRKALFTERAVGYKAEMVEQEETLASFRVGTIQRNQFQNFTNNNPKIASDNKYDFESIVANGHCADKLYCRNLDLINLENAESTRDFHSLFIERILEDGHEHYVLKDEENAKTSSYEPPSVLEELLSVKTVPYISKKQDFGKVSDIVKLKSHIARVCKLDLEKLQKDCLISKFVDIINELESPVSPVSSIEHFFKEFLSMENSESEYKNLCKAFGDNESHNQLLKTFFEDKQNWNQWKKYACYRLKYNSTRALKEHYTVSDNIGHADIQNIELHLKMNAALDTVFDWKIAQNGTYKGKNVAYEPMNDTARKKSYAAIEKIVPSLGKAGRGREWFQRTQGLQKWFEKQNMQTDFYKVETTQRNNRTGKEYMWVLDEMDGKEYADMMQTRNTYSTDEAILKRNKERSHRFDSLRKC